MAQRRRKKAAPKKAFWNQLGKAAIKSSAGATLGATVGVIEETVSETAGQYTKALIAAVGVAGEIFIDPETSPILAEGAKASLYSGSALGGYELGKRAGKAAKETKHKRDVDRLRNDLMSEGFGSPAIEEATDNEVVPIPKAKVNGQVLAEK